MKPCSLSVVVPAFREAENLPELVGRVEAAFGAMGVAFEMIIVNDESGDGTNRVLAGLDRDWVRLINRTGERGLSTAVLAGMRAARHDVILVMDADLSHRPEQIPVLINAIQDGADFAVGSRYVPGGSTGEGWTIGRRLNSSAACALARPLTDIRDPMSGFFAVRRDVFSRMTDLNPTGYKIGLELLVKGEPMRVAEVPISFDIRRRGTSKLTLTQQVLYAEHVRRLLTWRVRHHPGPALMSPAPWLMWLLAAFSLVGHLWYITRRELVPDEAYYWVWSRHLSLSYFDHPPMVAYLIRASTWWFGTTEFGVRFFAVVLGVGSALVLARVGTRVSGDTRIGALVAVVLLVSPILSTMITIITPDTPAWFFSAVALLCAVEVTTASGHRRSRGAWWLGFGLCFGLAMLSKYTSVLLGGAVALALFTSGDGRKHLRTAWPWLGAVVACAVFAPVLLWNARNDWASFVFQFNHGNRPPQFSRWADIAGYIGGQMVALTPPVAIVSATILWKQAKGFGTLALQHRVLLLAALAPLLFFLVSSTRGKVEMNWPAMALAPLAVLVVIAVTREARTWRRGWLIAGSGVAAIISIFLHAPEALWKLGVPHSTLEQMFGWREMARYVSAKSGGAPIVCNRYQDAAELAFYLPDHPDLRPANIGGSRTNAYDYFAPPVVLPQRGCLLVDWPPGVPGQYFQDTITRVWVCNQHDRRIMRKLVTVVPDQRAQATTDAEPTTDAY